MSDYENFWELIQEEVSGKEVKEKLQKIKLKCLYISFFFNVNFCVIHFLAVGSRR